LLQSLRKDAGLRQVDLAARLGRSQSYVTKYESGERRLDLFELDEVCQALGLALADLVERYQPGGTGPSSSASRRN
jgi:transcriptional regulator with XRE-family HTH domain